MNKRCYPLSSRAISCILFSSLAFLMVLSLLTAFPLVASADILIEPNNSFYERHRSACKYLGRSFYANGESGFVSLKKAPDSNSEVTAVTNGDILNIMFTYNHKGALWGVTEIYSEGTPSNERPTGWIPMDQLLLKYDYIVFAEEHQTELHPYFGDFDSLRASGEMLVWSWPGSDDELRTFNFRNHGFVIDESFDVPYAYTDEEGREWVFKDYWYGWRNFWICISDPINSEITAFNPAPTPELWEPVSVINSPKGLSSPALIIILIVALVVITAVLVRVFWNTKKDS